jgi:hypothetical protein
LSNGDGMLPTFPVEVRPLAFLGRPRIRRDVGLDTVDFVLTWIAYFCPG